MNVYMGNYTLDASFDECSNETDIFFIKISTIFSAIALSVQVNLILTEKINPLIGKFGHCHCQKRKNFP